MGGIEVGIVNILVGGVIEGYKKGQRGVSDHRSLVGDGFYIFNLCIYMMHYY